ncbi:MAG: hypothetical protein KIS78_32580 [Labilithrix sp.]|nr:hypothetical protein [Labilithrix sp.]MCW5837176.1 hypothetical protein [Labilithrix sp.]
MRLTLAAGAFALLACAACNAAQRAAQEDPMKCERDPKCDKKRGRTADCSMQCSDDPACVERCEQVQAPNKLGR